MEKHHLDQNTLLRYLDRILDVTHQLLQALASSKNYGILKTAAALPLYTYTTEQQVSETVKRITVQTFSILEDGSLELVSEEITDKMV